MISRQFYKNKCPTEQFKICLFSVLHYSLETRVLQAKLAIFHISLNSLYFDCVIEINSIYMSLDGVCGNSTHTLHRSQTAGNLKMIALFFRAINNSIKWYGCKLIKHVIWSCPCAKEKVEIILCILVKNSEEDATILCKTKNTKLQFFRKTIDRLIGIDTDTQTRTHSFLSAWHLVFFYCWRFYNSQSINFMFSILLSRCSTRFDHEFA